MSRASESVAPLYSAEAEKAVLGSMLAHPDIVIDQVSDFLARQDFFVPAHQVVFDAILELFNGRQAIDIMTVHQRLVDWKQADVVGSPGILAELGASLISHLNVSSHAKLVKERSTLRHLQAACMGIVQDIGDNAADPGDVLDRAEAAVLSVAGDSQDDHDQLGVEFQTITLVGIEERQKATTRAIGIPTGFDAIDSRLTFGKGHMIVLAARPGLGKSALADQLRDNNACYGHRPGLINLEMTGEEIRQRTIARRAEVNLTSLITGFPKLTPTEMGRVREEASTLARVRLPINDNPKLTVERIRALGRRWKRRHEIDILYIDYLQLIAPSAGKQNRQEEVSHMSRSIKLLAKELEIPIVVLAQLNRKSEEEKRLPRKSDLRESGALEQDADALLFLHTDQTPEENGDAMSWPYKFICAKQRNGPTFTISMTFHRRSVKFTTTETAPFWAQ